MIRHIPVIDSRTVLRTMLIAGVLVALVLACAGTAAGRRHADIAEAAA